jgi:tetratricopeptide (TPR) repeat protein
MNKSFVLLAIALLGTISLYAQFHTLSIPQTSPKIQESQMLGVTKITIDYSSPALRDRDVWNNSGIIPQQGNPIPWRAGANMATTIEFSTDVKIEGQLLKAGKYGFHIIPKDNTYDLLFAHNYDQWGSYYLDVEKDVSLRVSVIAESCPKSEQLDYEFLNRTENTLVIGLEWGEKRIPFKVEVDLNETVIDSFRKELRGINTYHWQSWNDAALWCLEHNTNLEEALQWVNRSIDGGYGGFAANKNLTNTSTKVRLLKKLNRLDDMDKVISDAKEIHATAYEANGFSRFLLENGFYDEALDYCNQFLKTNAKVWFLELNRGISHYFIGNNKMALKDVRNSLKTAPEQFQSRLREIIVEIENKTFKLPGS